MKQVAETIANAIIAHQEANDSTNCVYALRADSASKRVGGTCRVSFDWNHDADRSSTKRLSGTCGTKIKTEVDMWSEYKDVVKAVEDALKVNDAYTKDHQYVIAGNADYAVAGEDDDEVLLSMDAYRTCRGRAVKGAEVVAVIR